MTHSNVQNDQHKYGKCIPKLVDEIPWNKLFVDIIGPLKIHSEGKDPLEVKAVTIIDPVTGWFEVTQYRDKTAITIKTLVKTMCLAWYPCPVEITYDQGGEFLGHEFKDSMIENEYGIKTKPA